MKKDLNEYQKLDWISFAIQEALNGNSGELEQALELVEQLRDEKDDDAHYDREHQMREDYESMVTPNPYGESPPGNPWG